LKIINDKVNFLKNPKEDFAMNRNLFRLLILALLVALLVPAVAVAAPPLQGGGTYTIQADDTLSKLAEKEYGDPLAFTAIVYYTNQKATEDDSLTLVEDPNLVEVGWTIYLPTPEEANAYVIGNIPGGSYNEAPILADRVAAGELPPVDERLPDNPLIIPVVESIGQYGGTLRRGFLGPSDHNNYTRVVYDALVRHAPDGSQVIPHIASGWESNADFTEWIVRLRPGAKWSDGRPFTADDIMFWYNDILLNAELMPSVPVWMQNADGTTVTVEKVSNFAVKWTFNEPNTAFLLDLANKDGADKSINHLAFAPAHYLKQFHPNYAGADLQAKVDAAGFETWTELFAIEALPHLSGNRPSMAAWAPVGSSVSDPVFTIRRNPYYIGVDPAGNQLPYIDQVTFTFFADKEALNLAAVGGEIDLQGRHINMSAYPVLVENADKGGYRVVTWPTFGGSDAVVMFNQTLPGPEGEMFRTKDCRIALSHAISREDIKELAFLPSWGWGKLARGYPLPSIPTTQVMTGPSNIPSTTRTWPIKFLTASCPTRVPTVSVPYPMVRRWI
jgi:ABC-type transport system substrate-binding protein